MAKKKVNTKKARGFVDELILVHEERLEVFYNRSEKWQDSQKGEEHSFISEQLMEIIGLLCSVLDALENWIEENK
jgi:hypothetical protein